jgi:hypothetical protein
LSLKAQTYLNKEWTENFGSPDSINWSSTVIDNQGQIITISNTYDSSTRADMLLTRQQVVSILGTQKIYQKTKITIIF